MLRRIASLALVVAAALSLAGCFVIAKNIPAGTGPINDPRLEGAWRGLDNGDNKPSSAFFHFQRVDEKAPLRLVWVEGKDLQIYDVVTRRVGKKDVFAATITGPAEQLAKMKPGEPRGYFIGFYEIKGDLLKMHLLDAEKVGALIASGKLKGTRPPGKYEMATLSGSPQELAAFLASPAAETAKAQDAALLRRLSPANN